MTDDAIDELIERLMLLRKRLGPDVYREAVLKASVAVAQAAMAEAERRSGRKRPRRRGNVIPFPAGGRGRISQADGPVK